GSGRSTSFIPAVPAALSVTTIAFIGHLPVSSSCHRLRADLLQRGDGIGRSRQCEYLMLLRSQATNQQPADRTRRPGDQDSHRSSSITAARSSAWPSMSFTDEGAASLLLVVLMRCPPWRSYLVQAARHGPALPRAPVRRARRHCGAPTGRHGAERSARDAERGGVRGEMRCRATCSSTMTRNAVRIPLRIGWKDLTRTPSAT